MHRLQPLVPLALAAALAACTGKDSTAAESEPSKAAQLGEQAKDAFEKARDGAGAKLAEWKRSVEGALDGADERIDELKTQAATLAGEEKKELDAWIAKLEPKRKELAAKLAELGKEGEEAWSKARPELERMKDELKKLVDERVK